MSAELFDAKTEFKKFFIELNQNLWFKKVFDCTQLEPVNNKAFKNNRKDKNWDYECEKLIFRKISTSRHVRPKTIKPTDNATLELSVFFEGAFEIANNGIIDPIKKLGCSFLIKCDKETEDGKKIKKESHWHLDKHDSTREVQTIHPIYHFEYGGSITTEEDGFDFGHFIILDTPRLMHPPLDLVLAIDFVVKNFYEYDEYRALTESDTYKRYIKNAQIRLWKPYALAFASNFHDFENLSKENVNFATHIIESPYNKKSK